MKKNTEALAKKIACEVLLKQFLLVGGTALSVYLEHRLSEDLDFASTKKKLPREAISMVLLHGFIKKSQKTPKSDLDTAGDRRKLASKKVK